VLGVGILIVAVMALSGGDDGGSTGSPDGAVRGLMEAVLDGDCEAAGEFVTANFDNACPDSPDEIPFTSLEGVETTSEEGSNATVQATLANESGETDTFDFEVVQVDGEWRVDGLDIGGVPGGEIPDPEVPEIPGS